MVVDFLATERHFADHLLPIYQALPTNRRGIFFAHESFADQIGAEPFEAYRLNLNSGPAVCAAFRDYTHLRKAGRPIVWAEHGAGQSYSNAHTSYAGGAQREGVELFLAPGPHPAHRYQAAYPSVPVVQVGCPKLDPWHPAHPKPRGEKPVVVLSWHWECRVCPETRSAFEHFRGALATLAKREGWTVLGHAHPRAQKDVFPAYQAAGIPTVASFAEVLERADVYVVDNSSTLFEFASTGRPVVVLNAPWYRRGARHGLRFWECADVGVQVDSPADLVAGIEMALRDEPAQQEARAAAVARVYSACDGRAAERAATAILEALGARDPAPVVVSAPAPGAVLLEALRMSQGPWGIVDPGWRVRLEPRSITVWDRQRRAHVVALRHPIQPIEFAGILVGRNEFKEVSEDDSGS